jgi:hypothetical protein
MWRSDDQYFSKLEMAILADAWIRILKIVGGVFAVALIGTLWYCTRG